MSRTDTLVWMDLEMTGLDPEDNVIIEIATIITDDQLNIVAEGPVIAVHQPDFELDKMDDWNVKTHNGSGLVERVKTSTVSMAEAEKQTIEFIAQHVKNLVHCGHLYVNFIRNSGVFLRMKLLRRLFL